MQNKRNPSAFAMELRLFCLELHNSPVKATYGVSTVDPAVLFPYRIMSELFYMDLKCPLSDKGL